jgi:beta-galactosidase/beta-glucuronidase
VTAQIGRLLPSTPSIAYHLEALLYEGDAPDAPLVAKAAAVVQSPSQEEGETEEEVALSLPVKRPRRWTAETPELYTLVLALRVGEEVQAESCRVGFRCAFLVLSCLTWWMERQRRRGGVVCRVCVNV